MHNILLRIAVPFLVSLLMATGWVFVTRALYDYNQGFGFVMGLNVFPLLAWTFGLPAFYLLMMYGFDTARVKNPVKQFAVYAVVWFAVILAAETVGYHMLNIQNIGTSMYPGLPLCDCLHAPAWMQIGYLLMAPIHLMFTMLTQKFLAVRPAV